MAHSESLVWPRPTPHRTRLYACRSQCLCSVQTLLITLFVSWYSLEMVSRLLSTDIPTTLFSSMYLGLNGMCFPRRRGVSHTGRNARVLHPNSTWDQVSAGHSTCQFSTIDCESNLTFLSALTTEPIFLEDLCGF